MKHRSGRSKGGEALYNGGVCFITDRDSCDITCVEMAHMAMKAGIKWIQLRDKHRDRMCLYRTALHLRNITREYGAMLVVNDYVDIAAAVDADGVHLGQDDLPLMMARKVLGPGRIIGISTHNKDQALKAQEEGADYIGFGPIYETDTKDAGSPMGMDPLNEVSNSVNIPVVAIGGISSDRVEDVIEAGADAVAIASAILKGNIGRNAMGIMDSLQSFS